MSAISQNVNRDERLSKVIVSSKPELVMIIDKHKEEVIDVAASNDYWESKVEDIKKALMIILDNVSKVLGSRNLRVKIETGKKELLVLDEGDYAKAVIHSKLVLKY